MLDTRSLPADLIPVAERAWEAIGENSSAQEQDALARALNAPGLAVQFATTLACSRFFAETLRRRPWLLEQLLVSGALEHPLRAEQLSSELGDLLHRPGDHGGETLEVQLRRFRQRHMLRIIWRDLNRLAPTLETTRDVSWLAEACIEHALAACSAELEEKWGVPTGVDSGRPQQLIVLAMGKFGAHELNLSSDIDLIFAYPEAGETVGGRRSLSNEEFFTRLGRALIAALDTLTVEGFVFRVDMRLRPYGESGALAHSFAALEAYYEEQGRDWERYALIKARPVSGDPAALRELEELLQPFVYRRYVDYSAIESLRSMKQAIVAEVRRRNLDNNVKLGRGGIREVEFIGQCFQLIRGGRDMSLQRRELIPVLEECAALGCLPREAVERLIVAYCFLRDTEHALQAWEDRQTQNLPADPAAQLALAHCMGFAAYEEFSDALSAHRALVVENFDALIAEAGSTPGAEEALPLWSADCDEDTLRELGFSDAVAASDSIETLFNSRLVQTLQAQGRERLDRFMPRLLSACAEVDDSDLALKRLLPLVSAVARRSAYLLLLIENPPALADLVALCAASPWIADALCSRPALLDELLDRGSLYSVPEREVLRSELRQQLARLPVEDLEGHMEALRYFKAAQILRVAASELAGRLPLMQVSDKLSFIAEACLEEVLHLAWAQMVARYGEPERTGEGFGFCIVAYGKLGGIELSYASDLDLVFVFDAQRGGNTKPLEGGGRSVDNSTFYTRLGQRIIHILETRMALGQLYEVDMRLRPSGASGLLASSIDAYARYQREDAWIWEHQALVRVRAIAGDPAVAQRIEALRRDILCTERDAQELALAVTAMREKMRRHARVTVAASEFDLKQGCGGIVDIEFMVQYAVLAWACEEPELARWSDNVRILEALSGSPHGGERGHLGPSHCQRLTEAYLAFRGETHRLALQQDSLRLAPEAFSASFSHHAAAVTEAWEILFGVVPGSEMGSSEIDSSELDNSETDSSEMDARENDG